MTHIRIQLGHALGIAEGMAAAEREYRIAYVSDPGDRDAALHLGHACKSLGLLDQAARCYVTLVKRDPDDDEAMREARNVLGLLDQTVSSGLAAGLLHLLPQGDDDLVDCGEDRPHAIVYDVSDLLAYFGHSRLPTGIQRVQLEVLLIELDNPRDRRAGVCCFVEGRQEWVELPSTALADLIRASVAGGDVLEPGWRHTRDRLLLFLFCAQPVRFALGAVLVNLGTSWWLPNYFLRLRDARARRDVSYVTMIYDLIPVMYPHYFEEQLVQDFVSWLGGVFRHADGYLAISQATKRDLLAVADAAGLLVDPQRVAVVPLDADFMPDAHASAGTFLPIEAQQEPFVLFVATVEPRKGHLVAFDAWLALAERLPPAMIPRLICVGRRGWCNAEIYEKLGASALLTAKVSILSGLNDVTLAALYDRCQFSIYPSLYEGWGLPVTEALCRGKVVVTTTSSSLPEAGGSFAVYVPPDDAEALASAVARLVADEGYRVSLEDAIRAGYRPRSWRQIAQQVVDEVHGFRHQHSSCDGSAGPAPAARENVFYWLGRSYAASLGDQSDSGEVFRSGLGWRSPENWGCRTRDGGGELVLRLPGEAGKPYDGELVLRLVGSVHTRCTYRVTLCGRVLEGVLARHEHRSLRIAIEPTSDRRLTVGLVGSTEHADAAGQHTGTIARDSIGLAGFMVRRTLRVESEPGPNAIAALAPGSHPMQQESGMKDA